MDPQEPGSPGGPPAPEGGRKASLRRALGLAAAPGLRRWANSWKVLRRRVERLRELAERWAPAVETEAVSENPDWDRRRREMEARALRVEEALGALEGRRQAISAEWDRALSELERVHEGWRLLREEVGVKPGGLPEGTVWDLQARTARLSVLWEHLTQQQTESYREWTRLGKAWRWLLTVSLPTLEAKGAGTPEAAQLPALRRRLEDLDRRWRDAMAEQKRAAAEEALSDLRRELEETKARAEALSAELEARKARPEAPAPGPDLAEELTKTRIGLSETLISLENLRREKDELEASSESAVKYLWRRLQEAETDLADLRARAAVPPPAPPPAPPAPAPAAAAPASAVPEAPSVPAPAPPPEEAPIPSLEAGLDPAWAKVLTALQGPIASAYAQLRRLSAGTMPEGHRTVLKLAAGSIAQASDLLKVVGDFLEEAGPPPSLSRLEPALEAALTVWEPALKKRGCALERRIEGGLPPAAFSAQALRPAFYQILRNAYEAMPRGGTLSVKAWKEGASLKVSFQDSGPGFPPSALPDPFKPFVSAKPGHLGLGLSLVRRTMRRARGEAEASNAKPKGALVTLTFATALDEPPSMG